MKLKRHYDPASLEEWTQAREAYVADNLARAREQYPDEGKTQVERRLRDLYIAAKGLPEVAHVEVQSVPRSGIVRLSQRFFDEGIRYGYLSIKDKVVSISTADDRADFSARIVRQPGYYCCFCDARVASSADGIEHVRAAHSSETPAKLTAEGKLPAPVADISQQQIDQINNPSGVMKLNGYECRIIAKGTG